MRRGPRPYFLYSSAHPELVEGCPESFSAACQALFVLPCARPRFTEAAMYFFVTGERSWRSTITSMSTNELHSPARRQRVAQLGDRLDADADASPGARQLGVGPVRDVEQIFAVGDGTEDSPAGVVHARARSGSRRGAAPARSPCRSSETRRRRTARSGACRCRSARRSRRARRSPSRRSSPAPDSPSLLRRARRARRRGRRPTRPRRCGRAGRAGNDSPPR